jgi:hypothetical protein
MGLGIVVLLGVGFLVFRTWQKPEGQRTTLTVRFVNFTNVAGTNLAIFTLSNIGHRPIEVMLPAELELSKTKRNDPGRACFPTLLSPSSPPLTVKIVPPETREQWRVLFDYYPMDFRDWLSRLLGPLGRRLGRQSMALPSPAHSDWMPPTTPVP